MLGLFVLFIRTLRYSVVLRGIRELLVHQSALTCASYHGNTVTGANLLSLRKLVQRVGC